MSDAFSLMADALHADPNMAAPALYTGAGETLPRPITVLLYTARRDGVGGGSTAQITEVDIRAADVPAPQKQDRLQIGRDLFSIGSFEALPGGDWRCVLGQTGR